MATVFMKWLETKPGLYDRGIWILTLGRIRRFYELISREYAGPQDRILEIGCGTGLLLEMMAARGAEATGIDISPAMLSEARARIAESEWADSVRLELMDASRVAGYFKPHSFDLIVSALTFSELNPLQQRSLMRACAELLTREGSLLILDEVAPASRVRRWIYWLARMPLRFLTWLLTRATTSPLGDFELALSESGFRCRTLATALGGTLVLYEGRTAGREYGRPPRGEVCYERLRHKVGLRGLLVALWALFFRILPPYPKMPTGLYSIGEPDEEAPVLLTGNFELTVRRLIKAVDGQIDAWLVVADSAGINVWCAAGGGYFTAEKVIAALTSSRVGELVQHRQLILPQLCANGVDGWRLRQETGWAVHWGPARAADIPNYIAAGLTKSESMARVRFPLKERLEMVTATLGFYGLMILIPVLLFLPNLFWAVVASLVGLSYFYAIIHPWLPGRDGLLKSIPLAAIALSGLLLYSALLDRLPPPRLFNWSIGLVALSVFTGAELQGMSPLMRGEQANWKWEAVIAVILGLSAWLFPRLIGWSS
jgi:ubiquinone/menaquinone biosynthesis C-methylase UbiE